MTAKTVFRKHSKERPFSLIANAGARDKRLSTDAKAILWYMLTLPPDWRVRNADLMESNNIKEHSLVRALKNLEDCGYLYRIKTHGERGRFTWEVIVFECPEDCEEWKAENSSRVQSAFAGSTGKRQSKSIADTTNDNHCATTIPCFTMDGQTRHIHNTEICTGDLSGAKVAPCYNSISGNLSENLLEPVIPFVSNTSYTAPQVGGGALTFYPKPCTMNTPQVKPVMTTDKTVIRESLQDEKEKHARRLKDLGVSISGDLYALLLSSSANEIERAIKSLEKRLQCGDLEKPTGYVIQALRRIQKPLESDAPKGIPLNTRLAFEELLGYLRPKKKSEFVMEYYPAVEGMPFRIKIPTSPTIFNAFFYKAVVETCEYTQEKTAWVIMENENFFKCPIEWIEFIG